jgi:hypothetical protein
MAPIVRVTVDTNVLDAAAIERIERAAARSGVSVEIQTVTVNKRERGKSPLPTVAETAVWDESHWGHALWGAAPTPELFSLDETPLGSGVLSAQEQPSLLEEILRVVSNGSFPRPGQRESLSAPQKRQLRDAMTLEAHTRHARDVFITNDRRGFINHGRRETLERLCETKIATLDEVDALWT